MANMVRGAMGLLGGLFVLAFSSLLFLGNFNSLWVRIGNIPIAGSLIQDFLQEIELPGGQYLLPLLGIFLISWGVSLDLRKSWARLAGAVIYGVLATYTVAWLVVIVPLDILFINDYRWYILAGGLLIASIFGGQAYALLSPKAEWDYAKQWQGKQVVTKCDRCGHELDSRGQCPHCEPGLVTAQDAIQSKTRSPSTGRTGKDTLLESKTRRDSQPHSTATQKATPLAYLERDGKTYTISKPETKIGRGPNNDIILNEPSVSGEHAVITFQEKQFVIRDKGSSNGTFVNGSRIEISRLVDGSELKLGRVHLTFRVSVP